ncbi:hypothetical protein C6A85_69765, partial [Mycobacterium sp. ITM-2017-0098]
LSVQALVTAVIIAGSWFGARDLGVAGVGWAYLVAEGLSAAILIGPAIVWLRGVGTDEDGRATRSRHAAPASRAWMRVGAVLVAAALPAVLLYAVERPT